MKMKNIISMIAIVSTLVFTTCKKKESANPTISGDALFTYVADGLKVTFTNTSTVAGDNLWEFGDTKTSTEKSPVHTYDKKGEYTVTLTITDKNGGKHDVSTKFKVDKTSPIKLEDNSFSDWTTISDAFTPNAAVAGIVKSFKYDFDKNMIYFYLKVETPKVTTHQILDMLFNTTLDDTGYPYGTWPKFGGSELLVENSFSAKRENNKNYSMEISVYDPKGGADWDKSWVADGGKTANTQKDGTYKVTGNVIEIEFGVSRKNIPALQGKEKVKIVAWTSNPDWDENGWIPNKQPDDPKAAKVDGIMIDMQ